MDLSKLPRMSKTDPLPTPGKPDPAGPEPGAQQPPAPIDYERAVRAVPGPGAEAWISIAIGVILLLMQRNLVTWAMSKLGLSDPPPPFSNPQTGRFDVPYEQTVLFFHDLGLGLFAVALILEGIVLLLRRTALMWAALGLMVLATAWNLITVIRFYPTSGLQILPALAVAFGAYIAIHQWRVLRVSNVRSEI